LKSGAPVKPPAVDPDLIAHLEMLLEHARKGEVQGYCAGFVVLDDDDHWFMADEGFIPLLSFATRKGIQALESDDD
jgi:hypothetical protein